jgi:hypothetical protein
VRCLKNQTSVCFFVDIFSNIDTCMLHNNLFETMNGENRLLVPHQVVRFPKLLAQNINSKKSTKSYVGTKKITI